MYIMLKNLKLSLVLPNICYASGLIGSIDHHQTKSHEFESWWCRRNSKILFERAEIDKVIVVANREYII